MPVTSMEYKICSSSMPSVSFASMITLPMLYSDSWSHYCSYHPSLPKPKWVYVGWGHSPDYSSRERLYFRTAGGIIIQILRKWCSISAIELTVFSQKSTQNSNRTPHLPHRPERHQLLVNYRSHSGIVKCANAIIDLLQKFPGVIDFLRPEAVAVGRELPKFFHGEMLPSNARDFFCNQP